MHIATPRLGWPRESGGRAGDREELAATRELMQGTLDALPARLVVLNERGDIVMANRAWREFAEANGAAATADLGSNYLAACDGAPDDDELAREVAAGLRELLSGKGTSLEIEYPCHTPAGEAWFELRASRHESLGAAHLTVAHQDVTLRHRAQSEAQSHADVLDELGVAVTAVDEEGKLTSWNDACERLFGWTRAEALGTEAAAMVAAHDLGSVRTALEQSLLDGHWRGELDMRRRDGTIFRAEAHNRRLFDEQGMPAGRTNVFVDVSKRREAERALLGARNYLRAVTDAMGEGLCTTDPAGAITYMNASAEGLLGWSAREMTGCSLHELVHPSPSDAHTCVPADCPILWALKEGTTVSVEDDTFVGSDGLILPVAYTVAPFMTDDGIDGCAVVFADITERKAQHQAMLADVETLSWIGRVQDALAEDRFELYAQPIVDLRSEEIIQRELLLRMHDENGEIIAPGAFLPVAERYGQITDIDHWVIERATEIAAASGAVELNLSARSIGDPRIIELIETCLKRTGVDPGRLVFEITETALMANEAAGKTFVERMHALGCRIALDDFGTGYGGFTYLKQLPVDMLKIDIEFVRDVASTPASRHVVEAVVALARSFNLKTVAEGVEDAETLEFVRELGVDFAQGYHIARPAPIAHPAVNATLAWN